MWEDYKQYKEEFAYIQHSQFYIALKKLNLHNIISIENGVDGRYTIKLTHFMNEETEKQIHTYILVLLYLLRLSLSYL